MPAGNDSPDWTATGSPLVFLGIVSTGPNSGSSLDFTVDGGSTGLLLDAIVSQNLTSITVTDLANNRLLYAQFPATTFGPTLLPFAAGAGNVLRVLVQAGAGGTSPKVAVYQAMTPLMMQVDLHRVGGSNLVPGQQANAQSIPVVLSSDQVPLLVTPWSTANNAVVEAGAGVQAVATVAGIAGVSHHVIAASASIAAGGAAPAANAIRYQILSGANVLWSQVAAVQAVAGSTPPPLQPVAGIIGGLGGAMSCQCSGGLANTFESASIASAPS